MALSKREEVKICDFGFAQEIDLYRPQYSEFGTPEFVAPEIVCQQPVSKATDIWSEEVLFAAITMFMCDSDSNVGIKMGIIRNNRENSFTMLSVNHFCTLIIEKKESDSSLY